MSRKPRDYRGMSEVNKWKQWAQAQDYSVNTLHKWGDTFLRIFFGFCWDNYKLQPERTGFDQVLAFKRHLGLDEKKSKTTKNNYLDAVFSYFEFRKDQNPHIDTDLYIQIKTIGKFKKAHKKPYEPLPLDQFKKMLDITEIVNYPDFAFLMVLGYTGGRAQFYGLRQSEVFPDAVPPQIRKVVKGGKMIHIPLHPELAEVLKRLLETRKYIPKHGEDFYFEYGRPSESNLDFAGNQQRAEAITKKYAKLAEIPEPEKVIPHRFRKMTVTAGKKMGLERKEAQVIVGHSDIGMTDNIYDMPELQDIYDGFSQISFRNGGVKESKPSKDELIGVLKDLFNGFSKEEVKEIITEALT